MMRKSKRSPICRSGMAAAAALMLTAAVVDAQTPGLAKATSPLPLAANWNCRPNGGYGPVWQWKQIQDGHHLLFTFRFDKQPTAQWARTYRPIFEGLAQREAPLCLRWGNWLSDLKDRSPVFSDVNAWRGAGEKILGRHRAELALIQQWYPNPPYVVMLANNEDRVPSWKRVVKDERYAKQFGPNQGIEEQKATVAKGYIERYKALFDGMRAAAGPWGDKLLFIGYAWGGQSNINLYNRLDTPLVWDGVSARNYRARSLTDHTARSTQVAAMNLRLKNLYYDAIKDRSFFEVSTWDGKKSVSPVRYGGLATFALWVAKPDSIRHFTGWGSKVKDDWPYYSEVVEAVDQVHDNQTLRTFWKQGKPVVNPHVEINMHVIDAAAGMGTRAQGNLKGHVSQAVLEKFDRLRHHFYALPTSVAPENPTGPGRTAFSRDTEFAVWALAQVIGEKPNRRWLVFAYAPLKDYANVRITIPDSEQRIALDVPQQGVFAVVEEGRGLVKTIPTLALVER